jgi:DNA ligase-1
MYTKLFGLEKDGKIKVWEISTTETSIVVRHGQEDGKMQEKTTVIKEGKQKRSIPEQAVSEAEGKIKKQIDKGYRYTKEELAELPLLAMLAGDYHKIGHRINWQQGVDLSDKLDGVRCLAKCISLDVVTLESRTGQEYILPHITAELATYMRVGEVLDGEIYLHGYALQEITSAVKRTDTWAEVEKCEKRLKKVSGGEGYSNAFEEAYCELAEARLIHELRPKLQFIAFDVPSEKKWDERLQELIDFEAERTDHTATFIKFLHYTRSFSETEMKLAHKDSVRRCFEGIMLRNACGMYESGKRSADLQKYKEFLDSEFQILDVLEDKDGNGVFLVQNTFAKNTFTVTLGSHAQRKHYLHYKHLYIGKWLTVKYQTLYKGTMIPQFPCGLVIRDYE